jgi:formamidopyrimidine-DNA glycosylase
MPELPEVETTRRGIAPLVAGQRVTGLKVRHAGLRWPVPTAALRRGLVNQEIMAVERRAKYLLLRTAAGSAILHLGMSGSLRLVPAGSPAGKHDHVDIELANGHCLRLTDPRRFGALLWTREDPLQHALLRDLGHEPLDDAFDGDYLFRRSRGRKVAVKALLMDSHVVAGVGNIYANEALFLAGIHPARAAGRIGLARYERLAACVKQVLAESLAQGGTTLRDFVNGDGQPGYFSLYLRVYGKGGQSCPVCKTTLKETRQGQRTTVYCPCCQR